MAVGRRCSATTVLCYPVVTPFKQVAMPFNYANAVTKRGHAFAVPLAVFGAKPVRTWQFSWKCPLRGQYLTVQFFGYALSAASTSLCEVSNCPCSSFTCARSAASTSSLVQMEVPTVGPYFAQQFVWNCPLWGLYIPLGFSWTCSQLPLVPLFNQIT